MARGYASAPPPRDGILPRSGDSQKVWTECEIGAALARWGFAASRVMRVAVPWRDEGLDPADLRGLSGPWDWLAIARRLRG